MKSKKQICSLSAFFLSILVLTGFLSACNNESSTPNLEIEDEISSSTSAITPPTESSNESSHIDMGLDFRLPLDEDFNTWRFSDPLPDNVTPQLICKDEIATRIALMIQQLLPMGVNSLPFFDDETPLDTTAAVKIALENTNPIDLSGSSYTMKEGFRWDKYPNHPITVKLAQVWEEGNSPSHVFYAEDVSATLESFFGITDWSHCTIDWYHYFPEEKIYIMYGDGVWRGSYPQILSYQKTEKGYSCEVILTDSLFSTIGEEEVTESNIENIIKAVPKYVFTFDIVDGELVVTSFTEKA